MDLLQRNIERDLSRKTDFYLPNIKKSTRIMVSRQKISSDRERDNEGDSERTRERERLW